MEYSVPELRLAELARATGGGIIRGDPQVRVSSYEIDTRRIEPGAVFFALKGSRADGHAFLGEARRNGAAAAVVDRDPGKDSEAPDALLRVDDTVAALGRSGAWVRRQLKETKWIAVTGSNGKTTTKEMLAAGLSATFGVYRTPGNFNNHLGVPLTLLACPADAEVAVVEMAMSSPGEIADLARMTDPSIGLVTNVRAAHLEAFRSLDDIAAAKGELFAVMRDEGTAVVNIDDAHVRVQAARHGGARVTFGQHATAEVRLEDLNNRFIPGAALSFSHAGQTRHVQLRIGGAHAAFDALAAFAGVVAAGGDLDLAVERVEQVAPGPGRGQVHRLAREMILIDDSYNSSPSAMASILETLRLSEPAGRKVLVMGDMLELGPIENALHREAGKRAAGAGVQMLIAVGTLCRDTAEAAKRSGVPEVYHHKNSAKAAESIASLLKYGDLILVKGSRAIRMERIVSAIVSELEEVH